MNPSWEAVKELKEPSNVKLIKKKIEVVYNVIDKLIPNLWEQYKPSVIIKFYLINLELIF